MQLPEPGVKQRLHLLIEVLAENLVVAVTSLVKGTRCFLNVHRPVPEREVDWRNGEERGPADVEEKILDHGSRGSIGPVRSII